ncbi:hypothetical protein AB0436_07705 [Streptomyces sp. NPDC051322]|uniref:hypothetical protein n=1 Tax=Streptomyces sp. NPDC051322 TaxID=3154645 RepID=UPI00344EF3A1
MLVDRGCQAQPEFLPPGCVGQPVTGHRVGDRPHAHGHQLLPPDQSAPFELGGPVGVSGHAGELLGAGGGRAAPGQPRRSDVQHRDAGRNAVPARVPQQRRITDPQRQLPWKLQSGGVLAQRPDGDRHGRRADVQRQPPGQFHRSRPVQAYVDQLGGEPAPRSEQGVAAPDPPGARAVHIDRDPGDGAHLVVVLVQRLQTPYP